MLSTHLEARICLRFCYYVFAKEKKLNVSEIKFRFVKKQNNIDSHFLLF